MIKVATTLEKILTDIKTKLPLILQNEKLKNLEYGLGYPADQSKLFCAVRFANTENSFENEVFNFTIHLQLLVNENEAYKYLDCVNEYLCGFNPGGYDFHTGAYKVEVMENFKARDVQVFFDVTLTRQLDDCFG